MQRVHRWSLQSGSTSLRLLRLLCAIAALCPGPAQAKDSQEPRVVSVREIDELDIIEPTRVETEVIGEFICFKVYRLASTDTKERAPDKGDTPIDTTVRRWSFADVDCERK